ncbi:MAG TPA: hypothetical protein PLM81_05575 [Ginsengibacter sp.]|nr:hypothetical protein [Ginsengibacter sp.]
MKKKLLKLFVLLLIVFIGVNISAAAQSLRSPTQKERQAIDKVVRTVMPIISSFANNNWTLTEGGADDPEDYAVQIKPDVVMGAAPFSDFHFSVVQGTQLWNTELKPLYDKMTHPKINSDAESADYDKLSETYEEQSEVVVEVHVNQRNLAKKPEPGSKVDLKIPGCFFSYKSKSDSYDQPTFNDVYYLAFGNWKNTKEVFYTHTPSYNFSFVHPKGSPFVENIVIILKGNASRVKELVYHTDWRSIIDGLSL